MGSSSLLLRRCAHRLLLSYSSAGAVTALRRFSSAASAKEDPEQFDSRKLPTDYDPATFDPAAPPSRSPPSDRVWRLVDEVSSLSLIEVAELTCILREKMGIKEPPIIGIMNAGAGGGGGGGQAPGASADGKEEKKEKTVFDLKLESFDAAAKIKVIKEVRGFTDLGLKEAKELVEKAPTVIKSGLLKEEAEKIIEKMKAAGAKVVME